MRGGRMTGPIYVVSTVRPPDKWLDPGGHISAQVGWYPTYQEAYDCVVGNYGDIYEAGWYPYALIEAIEPGLYRHDFDATWFEWMNHHYVEIDEPEFSKGTLGLGFG
jgi:hypothetical protein